MKFLIINSVNHNYELYLVINNGEVLSIRQEDAVNNKDDIVFLLEQLLQKHKFNINNLDFIGAVTGPGSYTALRAGLALANALSLALKVPLIGVSLFEVLLASWRQSSSLKNNLNLTKKIKATILKKNEVILTAIPNYKGGFFVTLFSNYAEPLTVAAELSEDYTAEYLKNIAILHLITIVNEDVLSFLKINAKILYNCCSIDVESLKHAILEKHGKSTSEKYFPLKALYIKEPKITIKNLKDTKRN